MVTPQPRRFTSRGRQNRHFDAGQLVVEGPKELICAVVLHGEFEYTPRASGRTSLSKVLGLRRKRAVDDLDALAALVRRGGPLAARRAAARGETAAAALSSLGYDPSNELVQTRAELAAAGVEPLRSGDVRGLGDLADPPAVLFAWGRPPTEPWAAVAVVGTRSATPAGIARSEAIARDLATAGVLVVSGLALGIDGAAHRGALAAGGCTIGILGGGHERFFPPANRTLAREIVAAGGCVLSEYPPSQPAYGSQFLERNRLVAALARGVVVVESGQRGGAINTAGWAMELGRELFAVPWDADRPKGAGCLRLLREGARAVAGAQDICEDLGLRAPAPARRARRRLESIAGVEGGLAERIVAALAGGERCYDDLVEACGAPIGLLRGALAILEMHGVAQDRGGGRVALVP